MIPFITTVEEARKVVARARRGDGGTGHAARLLDRGGRPRSAPSCTRRRAPLIDFFDLHMPRVEAILGRQGMRQAARLHGLGDVKRYNNRMAAVEYAIEHDDGQSLRALDNADVILLAPSRCGKTPDDACTSRSSTALHVANYPLVDEDLESTELPRPGPGAPRALLRTHHHGGPPEQGAQRAASGLSLRSPEQCRWELRRGDSSSTHATASPWSTPRPARSRRCRR